MENQKIQNRLVIHVGAGTGLAAGELVAEEFLAAGLGSGEPVINTIHDTEKDPEGAIEKAEGALLIATSNGAILPVGINPDKLIIVNGPKPNSRLVLAARGLGIIASLRHRSTQEKRERERILLESSWGELRKHLPTHVRKGWVGVGESALEHAAMLREHVNGSFTVGIINARSDPLFNYTTEDEVAALDRGFEHAWVKGGHNVLFLHPKRVIKAIKCQLAAQSVQ